VNTRYVRPPNLDAVAVIARAVMFLASDEATSLNGTDLDVTGGWPAKSSDATGELPRNEARTE
jgi:NAD(P)-dependent dehydrogenase (short-subunit alcohol dehydrogenase family)